jgi:transposase-like protein
LPKKPNALRLFRARSKSFADELNHINGIESFWSFAKRRLQKFNGVSQKTFY